MAVVGGKNAELFVMDADRLGGYLNGPGNTDDILLTIPLGGALFGRVAGYPLDGGWIYVIPTNGNLRAIRLGIDAKGKVSVTSSVNVGLATSFGVGSPMVTSFQGQPGTGL
ncbi:hypothetical protein HDU76_010594, partial [Blyttiomyces sp. JEL0837]